MGRQNSWLAGLMAAAGIGALYRYGVRPGMYNQGATAAEVAESLPGDELVEVGLPRTTRGVTIDAPVEAIWPWLAQIGEDRGGFYSYDWLERLAGTRIHNADVVHPEWQELQVGDTVWLARRYGNNAGLIVADVQPKSHLVLMAANDFERVRTGRTASGSWAFYLRPDGRRTRLLARGSGGAVGHATFDIPHFVMERKMLLGIRDRVAASGVVAASRPLP